MILYIFLTILLVWLVLMGAYWLHGRKGVGHDGGRPAHITVREWKDRVMGENTGVTEVLIRDGWIRTENKPDSITIPVIRNTCRGCGKPMDDGSDTCSDCYGDPNHP